MKELLKLNIYFIRYKKPILIGVVLLTLSNLFLVWIPVLIRETMDEVNRMGDSTSYVSQSVIEILLSPEAGQLLAEKSMLLILAVGLYALFLFGTRQTIIVTSRKIEYDLRNEIYDHLQLLPQSYFQRNSTGDIYVRVTEDIARVREYFGPAFMYGINTITRAGIIVTIMFLVNAELTLWALLPLPVLSLLAYWMSHYIHVRSNEIQEQYAKLAARAQEAFSSIRLIKAYGREEYENDRFAQESDLYRKSKLRLDIIESLFHPMLNLLIGSSIVLVVWQGGIMVIDGTITVGNIAEFIIDVIYLTWPIASLGYTLNLLQRSAASYIRIQKLLGEETMKSHSGPLHSTPKIISGDIEFRNVNFKYPGADEWALRNVSLKIKNGSNIAIVGKTGSGKSSLVQLIPRIFDATDGDVLIDGVRVDHYNPAELHQMIAYVPQEPFLFSDTLYNNIAFGKDAATHDEVSKAAKKAEVLENILLFEKKFETILGERGITLSGGQKQRVTIARAMIKNAKILIFDDSLSAVDTKTENAIVGNLKKEPSKQTTITISHRISSIKHADEIFVLDNGKIVESGTHTFLIRQNGMYASLYKRQLIEQELAEL